MARDRVSDALDAFRTHGGVLRTRDVLAMGIHPRTLYRMRDEGVVDQISRGVFRLASLPGLSNPDLVAVAMRVPRAVVCLISALVYHDCTSEVPHEVQIALPRRTKPPKIDHPPLRVFWFSDTALSEGVQTVVLDGIEVRIFDLPKTVVDCFRFRNKLGLDVAVEALNQAIKRKGVQPAELLRYARLCRAERIMRHELASDLRRQLSIHASFDVDRGQLIELMRRTLGELSAMRSQSAITSPWRAVALKALFSATVRRSGDVAGFASFAAPMMVIRKSAQMPSFMEAASRICSDRSRSFYSKNSPGGHPRPRVAVNQTLGEGRNREPPPGPRRTEVRARGAARESGAGGQTGGG